MNGWRTPCSHPSRKRSREDMVLFKNGLTREQHTSVILQPFSQNSVTSPHVVAEQVRKCRVPNTYPEFLFLWKENMDLGRHLAVSSCALYFSSMKHIHCFIKSHPSHSRLYLDNGKSVLKSYYGFLWLAHSV